MLQSLTSHCDTSLSSLRTDCNSSGNSGSGGSVSIGRPVPPCADYLVANLAPPPPPTTETSFCEVGPGPGGYRRGLSQPPPQSQSTEPLLSPAASPPAVPGTPPVRHCTALCPAGVCERLLGPAIPPPSLYTDTVLPLNPGRLYTPTTSNTPSTSSGQPMVETSPQTSEIRV